MSTLAQKGVSYSALVLDPASHQRLLRYWEQQGYALRDATPGVWINYGHHVTLQLGALPVGSELAALKGRRFAVSADAIGVNPAGTVVALRVHGLVRPDGKQAHVTLAVHGLSKPRESNDIRTWEPLVDELQLTGTVEEVGF